MSTLIMKLAGAHVLSKTFALSTLSWKTPCSERGDLLGAQWTLVLTINYTRGLFKVLRIEIITIS
jgi:hypothetical protein